MDNEFLKIELEQMKENYRKNPLKDLEIYRPSWMENDDPMLEMYAIKRKLLQEGVLTYASIVQANALLYRGFMPLDCPAQIIYSSDIENDNFEELYGIAFRIYQYKGQDLALVDDKWKEVSRVITDEKDRQDFVFTLDVDDDKKEYRMIPTMIHRKLLPKRKLCGSILPVLFLPEYKQVVILPKEYWTKRFTEQWVSGNI